MSEEQFGQWYGRRSRLPLAVKGHTFMLKGENLVVIDGGKFVYEEAMDLVRLLNSKNPLAQISASVTIAERNGSLRLIVLALLGIIVVAVILLTVR
jgi:hypothetical protein